MRLLCLNSDDEPGDWTPDVPDVEASVQRRMTLPIQASEGPSGGVVWSQQLAPGEWALVEHLLIWSASWCFRGLGRLGLGFQVDDFWFSGGYAKLVVVDCLWFEVDERHPPKMREGKRCDSIGWNF